MAENDENDMSGAPDENNETKPIKQASPLDDQPPMPQPATVLGLPTKPQPEGEIVWDENNQLVHPELNAAAKMAHKVALGEMTAEEAGMEIDVPSFGSPEEAQAAEGQTRDPLTSPEPVRMQVTEPIL